MNPFIERFACRIVCSTGIAILSLAAYAYDTVLPFIPRIIISSTIPANGDLNPYGLAFVPDGFAPGDTIARGDVLVSNFNAKNNLQGTGRTIIKLTPNGVVAPAVPAGQTPGKAVTFFTGEQPGLTLALGVLRGGFVIVGNVPTKDGTSATISDGKLQVADKNGKLVGTFTDHAFFDSPWGLTVNDRGNTAQIFVANVLSGTVSRLDVTVGGAHGITINNRVVIANDYTHRTDPSALVVGPTGLLYNSSLDVLYVASTADNKIFAVPDAGHATIPVDKGTVVFADTNVLRGPLGLAFAPNGNLITSNGDAVNPDPTHPSEVIEFTASGKFVRQYNIDAGADAAFQVATVLSPNATFNFAAVNDNNNTVAVYALPTPQVAGGVAP
jgi:hypothetical protein